MSVSTYISRHPVAVAALFLIASTLLVYAPVIDFQFIHYDDDIYVTNNPWVKQGLTWQGARWAMTALEGGSWHPLTWLSHMVDVQLFGLNPSGHHLTNLLLHLANALLLFGVLQRMTGAVWRSALVSALFALHPLNLESVAWVAERKNVLSTLFWLLTIWAYVSYVRKPDWQRYLGIMGAFVLGLMAKPMLVTLPCVLLLMDYWPLGRLGKDWREFHKRVPRLVAEKLPLLIPVAAISVVTIAGQSQVGALSSWEWMPLGTRVGNAVLAYGLYLKKMVWPYGSGGFLSPSGKLVGSLADGLSRFAAGDSLAGRLVAGSKVSLSGGGVVLVSRNTFTGQRSYSSRWTGHGRPICLHSLDGSIHHHGLGWGGHDAP